MSKKKYRMIDTEGQGIHASTLSSQIRMKLLVAAITFLLLTIPSSANAEGWEGTHPHDKPERIVRGMTHRNNKRSWGYAEIQRYYASRYRTYTHMLHPYYRSQPYERLGRIPDNQFRYPYGHFAQEVIRPDRVY